MLCIPDQTLELEIIHVVYKVFIAEVLWVSQPFHLFNAFFDDPNFKLQHLMFQCWLALHSRLCVHKGVSCALDILRLDRKAELIDCFEIKYKLLRGLDKVIWCTSFQPFSQCSFNFSIRFCVLT